METKKEPKRDPVRKGPDKKTSPVNNNLILSLLVVGAVLFVVVTVFNNGSEVNIAPSDLRELIERTDNQPPAEASIEVIERNDRARQIQQSQRFGGGPISRYRQGDSRGAATSRRR